MTQDERFLQAVCENPDDEAPRLVYADYLDERGDPKSVDRAEFIRLQCELARMPPDDPRLGRVRERAEELLERHESAWSRPVRPLVTRWEFRRGFIEVVATYAYRFLRNAEKLFRLTPLREVHPAISSWKTFQELIRSPHLARLTGLNLSRSGDYPSNEIELSDPHKLKQLFTSRHLTGLTALRLGNQNLRTNGLQILAAWAGLPRLRQLDLPFDFIEEPGIEVLVAAPLDALTDLNLAYNHIGPQGGQALAASPLCRRLTALNLEGNHVGDAGALAFLEPPLDGLRYLDLSENEVSRAGAKALRERFGKRVRV